jgi:VacB/RNase II family 3'-5' exoribonuclease
MGWFIKNSGLRIGVGEMGNIADYSGIDLKAIAREAMDKYGFKYQFSEPVLNEVNALNEGILLKGSQNYARDLRSLLWSSIDNEDSLDLDQLEYCERGLNQETLVKVAIADVDLFVPKESQTDRHALKNGTSVYTGIEIFPMLPERLSNDLSSLRAGQDRPAVVIELSVLSDGSIRPEGVYRAIVRNKAKLIYEEIGDFLEGESPVPSSVTQVPGLEEQLALQDETSQRLRKFRMEQGALELDTIEPKPVVHMDAVTDLVIQRKNRARYLIENFMIAANVTMMDFLEKAGIPVIQRVVRTPKNWKGIMDVAAAYAEALPSKPDSKALSQFLIKQKEADPERFPDLSLTIVKLLGAGEYVMLEPGKTSYGHFGLAVMDYTHATAPNRRYVDVVLQRLFKSVLAKEPSPYTKKALTELSVQCTDRDKAAQKVERFMRKAAAAVLLGGRIGEFFDAIVTGASEKGTYVRIISPPVEGRVTHGEEGMAVGQKVRVRLTGMDPYKGFIDFEGVSGSKNKPKNG